MNCARKTPTGRSIRRRLAPVPADEHDRTERDRRVSVSAGAAENLQFGLPAGLIGNPIPLAQCTLGEFNANERLPNALFTNGCPADTQVGVAMITVQVVGETLGGKICGLITNTVPLFNLEPAPGEPARFGFYVCGNPVYLDTAIRTGSDYGITVNVTNTTQLPAFLAARVSIWGTPGDPRHDNSRGWTCGFSLAKLGEQPGPETCEASPSIAHPPPFLSLPRRARRRLKRRSRSARGHIRSSPACSHCPCPIRCTTPPVKQRVSTVAIASVHPVAGSRPGRARGEQLERVDGREHIDQQESLNASGLAVSDVRNVTAVLPEGCRSTPPGGSFGSLQ